MTAFDVVIYSGIALAIYVVAYFLGWFFGYGSGWEDRRNAERMNR